MVYAGSLTAEGLYLELLVFEQDLLHPAAMREAMILPTTP
jgi:hypothetical protein